MLRFLQTKISKFLRFFLSCLLFLLEFLLDDLKPNVNTRHLWEIVTYVATGISAAIISCLCIQPLATYYFESSYIGQFWSTVILIFLAAIFNSFIISRKIRYKRYTILFKLLTLPIAGVVFFLSSGSKLIKAQLHDNPR